jgi:arsenate reductase-like glutaredoxin family protein
MKKYAKVEGHSNLLRDLDTNAIINTDTFTYEQYTNLRNKKLSEKKKIESLESELQLIKSEIFEIKTLLKDFLNEPR